jgi:S1-C subfamily serine protease
MVRIAATVILAALFTASPSAVIDWTALAKTIGESVVFVQGEGHCTGFVIHADAKNGKDYVLTAAHCHTSGKELYADSATARILFKDGKKDLMILEVDDLQRPAVTLSQKDPVQAEDVGSFGHGYGLEQPMFRIAHVSHARIDLPDVEGGPFVMIDAGYVSGMSGGPVINAKGEVVSIVQRASGLVGIGIGAEAIRSKIARFLPKGQP